MFNILGLGDTYFLNNYLNKISYDNNAKLQYIFDNLVSVFLNLPNAARSVNHAAEIGLISQSSVRNRLPCR